MATVKFKPKCQADIACFVRYANLQPSLNVEKSCHLKGDFTVKQISRTITKLINVDFLR